ncbi:MAG: ATP-binding cassette domain-containing protein [Sneathiella sp.]|nr:ATP-binding cassette domain-containing protein [Sneathiella sp.]
MPILEFSDVWKGYGDGSNRANVLQKINLKVEEGEFVAIVGFSGSGKTTLISTMAGLIKPDRGAALFKYKEITGPGPERALVFQSYSLMPWLTVRGNIELAVNQVFSDESRKNRAARVQKYIDMVGLAQAADRRPAELSGGMRQRVSVARAMAMSPEVLLLDEPLSALDALTRARLQDEILALRVKEKQTVILITNDVDEAVYMADRIIPLTPGPGATLGQEFRVNIPSPRDRNTLNDDLEFKRVRGEVTSYLMGLSEDAGLDGQAELKLPEVTPITHKIVDPSLPNAYKAAGRGHLRERFVEFSQVKKIYSTPKGPFTVVDGFDLKMKQGEFISLIGHSGCGKSTVLSMVAGLNEISTGGIILDGKEVHKAGPDRAVVFQAPNLFPWMTASDNVRLGVDQVYPKATKAERGEIVDYYISKVGLAGSADKLASELSNGMKQRVGIARAFALSPKLLLLDEPFGMLDTLTRWDLQEVLMDVWKRTQVTAICVTHDVDEAILLADKVVMMTNGPNARIGHVMSVDLPRPRSRKALLKHPDYYQYRKEVLDFLEVYEGGADPDPETLQAFKASTIEGLSVSQAENAA